MLDQYIRPIFHTSSGSKQELQSDFPFVISWFLETPGLILLESACVLHAAVVGGFTLEDVMTFPCPLLKCSVCAAAVIQCCRGEEVTLLH